MNPYTEIDHIVNFIVEDFGATELYAEQTRDRLYTIVEEAIEDARNGEYEDE